MVLEISNIWEELIEWEDPWKVLEEDAEGFVISDMTTQRIRTRATEKHIFYQGTTWEEIEAVLDDRDKIVLSDIIEKNIYLERKVEIHGIPFLLRADNWWDKTISIYPLISHDSPIILPDEIEHNHHIKRFLETMWHKSNRVWIINIHDIKNDEAIRKELETLSAQWIQKNNTMSPTDSINFQPLWRQWWVMYWLIANYQK